jgi:hypothetical protein
MIVDRYDPVSLFQMVPKLKLQFEPELAHLDELLDDDELFKLLKADLLERYPNSESLGRHSTPVEVILRMLVVKRLQLEPTLEDQLRLFGKVPELVAADRNVHSKENEQIAKEMGVKKVCLPKAGKKSTEREKHERQRWFSRERGGFGRG